MSQYYSGKRTKNLYVPQSSTPFKLSRSKLELFMNCPRCFYMDRRLGVGQPPGFPFNLNSAVDFLLKKEFDVHRAKGTAHPLMANYGLDAVPFQHPNMDVWRENFVGVQYLHSETNFLFFGAVDDIWVNPAGELIVVDYKATSKDSEVNLDADWQQGYKNQMEIYQFLLRANGFKVSDTGYFVYCNGKRDAKAFDAKLEFDIKVIPYTGSTDWVTTQLAKAKACLDGELPGYTPSCDYCVYLQEAVKINSPISQESKPVKSLRGVKIAKKSPSGSTLF